MTSDRSEPSYKASSEVRAARKVLAALEDALRVVALVEKSGITPDPEHETIRTDLFMAGRYLNRYRFKPNN